MHSTTTSISTTANRPRGFVMILVLLLIAVLTVIVIGQLGVVQTQAGSAIADHDQVAAEAIADHCLARARIYLDRIRDDTSPADWDQVLDPNLDSHPAANGGAENFSDDFVPGAVFGGSIVYVPSSESSQTGLRQALHRWRLIPMDGGSCLVRYDDNADDTRAAGGRDTAAIKIEHLGKDVPYRDSDMGITINAIGIYPTPSGTPAVDAYARARARVTAKTFVGTGGAPGIVARDNITLESDIALCGLGGLQADKLAYSAGGSPSTVCACGDTATHLASAAHPGDCVEVAGTPGFACDDAMACQPGAAAPGSLQPTPDVKVPTPVDWLELSGFQDPTNPQPLGGNGVCEFYFRSDNVKRTWRTSPLNLGIANDVKSAFMSQTNERGEVFVWDHTDNDAQGCTQAGMTLAACPAARVVTHNCQTNTDTTYALGGKLVLKRPCAWNGGDAVDGTGKGLTAAANKDGPTVQCANPAEQTPCWKLIARLTRGAGFDGENTFAGKPGAATVAQDYRASGDGSASCGSGVAYRGGCVTLAEVKEHTELDSANVEVLSPSKTLRPPNIEAFWGDARTVASAPAGTPASQNDNTQKLATMPGNPWQHLCGPCPNCTGIDGWRIQGDEHFHFEESPMCGDNFFNPSILVFENQLDLLSADNVGGRFHVKEDWGAGSCGADIPRVTVIVQAHADIAENTRICGAYADCTPFPAPCTRASAAMANGLVIRAGGECYVGKGAVFTGDMQCGVIHVNNGTGGECIVGDLIAFNDASDHPHARKAASVDRGVCPDPGSYSGFVSQCTDGFCANQSFKMVGDLISQGDICIRQGAEIYGSVLGGGDGSGNIFIESDVDIFGQLVSEGSIGMKSNVSINNDGTGVFGSRVTSGVRVEGSW
jgi:hypothetical protein